MVAVVFKLCRELCRELCRVGEDIDMDVVVDLGCSFDPEPAGDLEAQFHGELPTQCGEKGSTKLATKLATKKNHTQNPEAPNGIRPVREDTAPSSF